jgi:hypothetical protein
MSHLVSGAFGVELRQWRDAERAGRTLEQYLTDSAQLPGDARPAATAPAPAGPAAATARRPERVAPASVRPARGRRRRRSRLVWIALIALAAVGLVAAGAAGALWWMSRSAVHGSPPALEPRR